ncbi:tyrosine-type recombinase/integrase [Candidatus Liberibacter solanacearum]|nr:tyrosine-type recombinase/integrase [Candidatus Liberibacter solanacearum]
MWYFRKDGKRIRLPDKYGSKEFMEAYSDALAGRVVSKVSMDKKGTLGWLIDQYKRSHNFQSLNASTKEQRNSSFRRIIRESEDVPYSKITRQHIQDAVDRRADKPAVAISFLNAITPVFQWAETRGLLNKNPVIGVKRPALRTVGFHTWTIEQVEQFRKCHPIDTKARLALELMLFLGLRRSDVIRIGKGNVKDGVLSFRTQKTNKMVYIPIFKSLKDCIDTIGSDGETFLVSSHGKPFGSSHSFYVWFKKMCSVAGLPAKCTPHGLRKAGATIAANAGASPHELMAMYGWSKMAMAELYTREVDSKKLAYKTAKMIADNT